MSFTKAADLLRLARMATRTGGVRLSEICERFAVSHRTAQRMTQALEAVFPQTTAEIDGELRRAWRLPRRALKEFGGIDAGDLALLSTAARLLERSGDDATAVALRRFQDRLLVQMPEGDARRADTDADALLETQGFAARPGPRVSIDPQVAAAIAEALKGPFRLEILYRSKREQAASRRVVEPLGVLLGARRYLVARRWRDGIAERRVYRIDRVREARVLPDSVAPDPDFDIATEARKAFGVWFDEAQYGEVVWRFAPRAAEHARSFRFHPDQVFEDAPDGGLIVRFRAAGWLEMSWYLYQWGDAVEVLSPPELAEMVNPWRRSDFGDALP